MFVFFLIIRAVDIIVIRTNVRIIHDGNSGIEGEGMGVGEVVTVGDGEGVSVGDEFTLQWIVSAGE